MPAPTATPALAPREQAVLERMARGLTNKDIGLELYLSEDTVKTYARRMFRKLGAQDRANAVFLGCRHGLLRLADTELEVAS